MRHPLLNTLACLLCLLALGVDMAMHVLCPMACANHAAQHDAGTPTAPVNAGDSAFHGGAFALCHCGHGDDDCPLPCNPGEPCECTGHDDGHHLTVRNPDRPSVDAVIAHAVVAWPVWTVELPAVPRARHAVDLVRPPDGLARLRAIIMLV